VSKLPAIIIGLILIAATVLIVDCANGRWVYYHGTITNHRYVPESTSVTTDSDGHVNITTYPEEFHLGFVNDNGGSLDLSTTQQIYNATPDDEKVWVKARQGRLGTYLAHISEAPTPEHL
jgi:hypothetical protein